jgi:hypothetical protein
MSLFHSLEGFSMGVISVYVTEAIMLPWEDWVIVKLRYSTRLVP